MTISTVRCDQGWQGVRRGLNRSAGGWWEDFPRAHRGHAEMKALVSQVMEGHQEEKET